MTCTYDQVRLSFPVPVTVSWSRPTWLPEAMANGHTSTEFGQVRSEFRGWAVAIGLASARYIPALRCVVVVHLWRRS